MWFLNDFQVLHGAERGETAALLLSPLRPAFKDPSSAETTQYGSQFTFFLTAPLQAFCQMVGLSSSDHDAVSSVQNPLNLLTVNFLQLVLFACEFYFQDAYNDAETILSTSFSEWEVILCTSTSLDLVWAQVLSDPFLRRLILR